MTMPYPFTLSVTVERPGGVDRYGDRLPAVSRTVSGCVFAPRSSTEGLSGTPNTVIVGLTMYAPVSAGITAADVVVDPNGVRWEVEGMPGTWSSPFSGWTPGVEVALRRVEG